MTICSNKLFDYNPINSFAGYSSTYTVPIGKYSILDVTLSARAFGSVALPGSGSFTISLSEKANAKSINVKIILMAGDVFQYQITPTTPLSSLGANGYAEALVKVNGVVVLKCWAQADSWYTNNDIASSSDVQGEAAVKYIVAEYNATY